MKKLAYIILFVLAIFSVCMLLFRWGVIPPVFGEDANADAKNEVMLNLSYSYLAGLIFYFLVTWFPFKVRSVKMRPFIDDKKKVIKGKVENCVDYIMPTNVLLDHKTTKSELIDYLSNTSLVNTHTFLSLLGPNITIQTHWRLQRDEIKEQINSLLQFRDYLSDEELKILGDLQNCQFFYSINGIFSMTDTPDTREAIANDLWGALAIARQL